MVGTCKHYAAYSLEAWGGQERYGFDVCYLLYISLLLISIYRRKSATMTLLTPTSRPGRYLLPPFSLSCCFFEKYFFNSCSQACVVEGRARSIMCSYNAVNGIPTCASDFLLQTVLRDQFQFDGYVVSDCDAVACIQENQYVMITALS